MQPHKKINILFVHYGDEAIRGSELCLINLLTQLDKAKFNPTVWCNSHELTSTLNALSIPVIQTKFSILFGWHTPRYAVHKFVGQVKQAKALIVKNAIDIVHCNSAAPCQWMSFACRATQTKIIAHLHAPYPLRDRLTLQLRHLDKAICVNDTIEQQLLNDGMHRTQLDVIHNGIDFNKLERAFPIDIKAQLKLQKVDILLATLGYLSAEKGVDNCIQLISSLLTQHKIKAHLMIIGDGVERYRLERLANELDIEEQIHFMGESDVTQSIMTNNVDIYVSGARAESFGLAIAEAAIAKLPIVAPNVGGIPLIVKHEKTGLLYEKDNINDFTQHVFSLLSDVSKAKTLASNAYTHVKKSFPLEKNVAEFESLYHAVHRAPIKPKPLCFNAYKALARRAFSLLGKSARHNWFTHAIIK